MHHLFVHRTRIWAKLGVLAAVVLCSCRLVAAEDLPPRPNGYFFDPGHFVPKETASQINLQLKKFEEKTSDQVVVAIFPNLPENQVLEDFTQRTAAAWKVGQKGRDNGVVLFIFVQQHEVRIEVGYGLEGALPDITARRIIANEIVPAFKKRAFVTGVTNGVNAILAAIQGEYRGTGATQQEQKSDSFSEWIALGFFGFVLLIVFVTIVRSGRGHVYGPFGESSVPGTPFPFLMPTDSNGRRNRGGDDGGGFDGGGFSGGGGDFGGGGASGRW